MTPCLLRHQLDGHRDQWYKLLWCNILGTGTFTRVWWSVRSMRRLWGARGVGAERCDSEGTSAPGARGSCSVWSCTAPGSAQHLPAARSPHPPLLPDPPTLDVFFPRFCAIHYSPQSRLKYKAFQVGPFHATAAHEHFEATLKTDLDGNKQSDTEEWPNKQTGSWTKQHLSVETWANEKQKLFFLNMCNSRSAWHIAVQY